MIRLNKHLANIGIASRRKIDQMISDGQIMVNNRLAVMGQKIDLQKDNISIKNKTEKINQSSKQKLEYIILNKPRGYTSTTQDPHNKKTVLDLVRMKNIGRLYPVGRLDKDSEGLILLTNDGDLTNRLTHPKNHVPKVYQVTILGMIKPQDIAKLKNGIKLEDGLTQPTKVKLITQSSKKSIFNITLYEGKKRQIRRMCSALHLHILKLERISLGPIKLDNLKLGKARRLSTKEVKKLKKA